MTPYLLALMDRDNPGDPVARQFLPSDEEGEEYLHLSEDPLREGEYQPIAGLIQRYPDRALVVLNSHCAAHCRYCFRKRLWEKAGRSLSAQERDDVVAHLSRSVGIREVIISGGDPLMEDDVALMAFLTALRKIPHVEVLRVATRVPSVLPMRITESLAEALASVRPLWVTVQVNHARELTPEMAGACDRLLRRGIPVLSQTVLLRGVNDNERVLRELFTGLERIMVKPYYLHQCDPVRGVEHFRTPVSTGVELMRELHGTMAGPAIPRFVVDCPGIGGKVPVTPPYLASDPSGAWVTFRNNQGEEFLYPNPLCPHSRDA